MKLKELKLSHIIKTAVFGILMLFPFLAGASKCIYVAANKNAYLSYTGYNLTTNTELATEIESGLYYQLSYHNYSGSMSFAQIVEVEDLSIVSNYTNFTSWYETNGENIHYIRYIYNGTITQVYFYDETCTQMDFWNTTYSNTFIVNFKALNNSALNNNDIVYRVYQQQVGNSLDNVFYYANEQVWEEPLFNWVESSALQTSIGAFVSVFGLSVGSYFNNLITYWLSLTIIFIVINLVLDVIEWLIDLAPFKKKKS